MSVNEDSATDMGMDKEISLQEEELIAKLLTEKRGFLENPRNIAYATFAVAVVFVFMSMIFSPFAENLTEENENRSEVRVPVWERGNLDYITDMDFGYVMEFGEYGQLETSNEWNSTHVFVDFELQNKTSANRHLMQFL